MSATASSARSFLGRQFTYANVASTLALVVALGTGTAYAANTVKSSDIVNGQVKTVDLGANAVTAPKIKTGAVNAAKIADNSITTADILDGTVSTDDLLDASIGSADIADESITAEDLGVDSVQATEIADDSIDSGEIVNESLFASDLASGSVGTSEIVDGSIGSADVANNSLTTADLAGTDQNGAISLGSGAVASGRCNFYTIGVPGATADQGVIISARDTLPTGVILYGVGVVTDGSAVMAACNFTGGTFPALSSFPIRTITFG